MEKIKGYKSFDKDLRCRGFQYEVGKEYTAEGKIECCKNGFHFYENPFGVFKYVPLSAETRYCEVEGDGEIDKYVDKVAVSHIRICKEMDIDYMIKECKKYIRKKNMALSVYPTMVRGSHSIAGGTKKHSAVICKKRESIAACTARESESISMSYCSVAACVGLQSVSTTCESFSVAVSTNEYSAAKCKEDCSVAVCTRDKSAALCNGILSAAICTCKDSLAYSTGCGSAAICTGWNSAARNTGTHSFSLCAINNSEAKVEGEESVAIALGCNSRAAGALGCWLFLVERNEEGQILDAKAVKVDGDKIKADTYYKLKNGEIIEA